MCKTFQGKSGPVHAVSGLDLRVHSGEIFGLLGPNGAGKTTTIRMICGLLRPTAGSVRVEGVSVRDDPIAARQRIGVVPEDAGHHQNLNLVEELTYYGGLYGLDRRQVRRRAMPLVEQLGLADRVNDRLKAFSRGMRRKVHLIRALLHEPGILLLDEPTAGLDPVVTEDVWRLLQQLAEQRGVTIVMCSHHLEEVERLCTRVGIIKGKVLKLDTVASLTQGSGRHRIELADATVDAVSIVQSIDGISSVDYRASTLTFAVSSDPKAVVPNVVRRLVEVGAAVVAVGRIDDDLRTTYRRVIGDGMEDDDR